MFRNFSLAAPPLLWAILIFIGSSRPVPEPVVAISAPDKLLHLLVYAVFALLLTRWFYLAGGWGQRAVILVAMLIAGLYGVTDEIHQSFVPTRSPETADAVADFIGAAFGAPFGIFIVDWWRKMNAKS